MINITEIYCNNCDNKEYYHGIEYAECTFCLDGINIIPNDGAARRADWESKQPGAVFERDFRDFLAKPYEDEVNALCRKYGEPDIYPSKEIK